MNKEMKRYRYGHPKLGAPIKAIVDDRGPEFYKHEKSKAAAARSIFELPNCMTELEIGRVVRRSRVEAGLSQKQLADLVYLRESGTHPKPGVIARIERGMVVCPLYLLQQIGAYTNSLLLDDLVLFNP